MEKLFEKHQKKRGGKERIKEIVSRVIRFLRRRITLKMPLSKTRIAAAPFTTSTYYEKSIKRMQLNIMPTLEDRAKPLKLPRNSK